MKTFTIGEDCFVWNYFDEIEFSYPEFVQEYLKKQFPKMSEDDIEELYEKNCDLFNDLEYEIKTSDALQDYCIGEEEIDEASGTWGYYTFEIKDLEEARTKLKDLLEGLFEDVIDQVKL